MLTGCQFRVPVLGRHFSVRLHNVLACHHQGTWLYVCPSQPHDRADLLLGLGNLRIHRIHVRQIAQPWVLDWRTLDLSHSRVRDLDLS